MFARLPDVRGAAVPVTIDGAPFDAREGDSVAAAVLASGRLSSRTTPITGAPRGPFCMMGVCFDCLVTVDGNANQQGCMIVVKAGMRIESQAGARALGAGAS